MVNKLKKLALLALALAALTGAFPSSGRYPSGGGYVGPGDILAGATSWYGLRGYSRTYVAPGNNPAIIVRRASDNTTKTINILTTAKLDIATANSFAGTDATCTGTASGTTSLSLSSCSSTPNAGDTLTSSGGTGSFTQPAFLVSCGTFTGGAGTCTMNAAQTVTGVTVTAQVGLFITQIFDQTGNGLHLTQATNATQPELVPSCLNTLPCLYFNGSNQLSNATTCSTTGIIYFASAVSEYIATPPANDASVMTFCFGGNAVGDNRLSFGSGNINCVNGVRNGATAAINVPHSFSVTVPQFGSLSVFNVDGTFTTGVNCGAAYYVTVAGASMGRDNQPSSTFAEALTGYIWEAGTWQAPASQAQQNNLCANQNVFWFASSLSCTATAPPSFAGVTGPCDLVTCAEAWSVTRAMTTNYTGPLFQLYNGTSTLDIGQNVSTRAADMTTWSAFCSGVASNCKFSRIYAQIHNSNNDLAPINFAEGCTITTCQTTFVIEGATSLPVFDNSSNVGFYSFNGNLRNTAGTAGANDQPAIGMNTGTNPHTLVSNTKLTTGATATGGSFGLTHQFSSNDAVGSDFQLFQTTSSPFKIGLDAEGHGGGDLGFVIPDAVGTNLIIFQDHTFTPVPKQDLYYNGTSGTELSPGIAIIDLYSGPYFHMNGGGDFTVVAPSIWREGFVTNNVLTAANRTSILGNETTFYSGLTFPTRNYSGPGDVVSGAASWYGLRGYSASYASPGTNPAIDVRRASDNATSTINITPSGNLDVYSAMSFAGIDVSCTNVTNGGASTTINLTGCSGTPHVGDVVYSVGLQSTGVNGTAIIPPAYIVSCGAFAGGAGSCVLNSSQNLSFGNQAFYALNALFVSKIYDQSGNGIHLTQATNANQPQLLPHCLNAGQGSNGNYPCLLFSGSQGLSGSTCGPSALPVYMSAVAERTGAVTTTQDVFDGCGNGTTNNILGWSNVANTTRLVMGATLTDGGSDNTQLDFQSQTPASSGNSTLTINNSATTGAAGNTWTLGTSSIGFNPLGNLPMTGYVGQAGDWAATLTGAQVTNLCHSDNVYWYNFTQATLGC